jgi:hypothetical protein
MSYLGTMTGEQLAQNGFDISPDDPNLAICRLYPHLSFRHRCSKCGNWSRLFNGECPQCFMGKKPIKPTKQYFKLYLRCCTDENCAIRAEARGLLRDAGMETVWTHHDGFGEYISLDAVRGWAEAEQHEIFATVNEFSVSKYGARLLCHPKSVSKSKLPKR